MKYRQLTALAIALFGFYCIFNAILVSSSLITAIIRWAVEYSDYVYPPDAPTEVFYAMIPMFLMPLLLGMVLIRNSACLSNWIFKRLDTDHELKTESISFSEVTFVLITLLGVYMLSMTIPAGFRYVTTLVLATPNDSNRLLEVEYLIPNLVYHFTSIGFSIFVTFSGDRLHRYINGIKKKRPNQTVQTT